MENQNMITVPVFADTTGQFTDEECDFDNVLDIPVPENLLYQWWRTYHAQPGASGVGDMYHWVEEECICDSTVDLYDWLVAHGYKWIRTEKKEEKAMKNLYCGSMDGHEVEVCSYCGSEVELLWDINKDGFQATCPYCGNRLMLCDACQHRTGEYCDDCNYCSNTDTCRFSRRKDWAIINEPWVDPSLRLKRNASGNEFAVAPITDAGELIRAHFLGEDADYVLLDTVIPTEITEEDLDDGSRLDEYCWNRYEIVRVPNLFHLCECRDAEMALVMKPVSDGPVEMSYTENNRHTSQFADQIVEMICKSTGEKANHKIYIEFIDQKEGK